MDSSDNLFLYQTDNREPEEQMYIIADDGNMQFDGLQGYTMADNNGENIIQLNDANGQIVDMNGEPYIIYNNDDGLHYIIDANASEANSDNNNNVDSNNNTKSVTYRCPSCTLSYQNANAFTKHMREKHFVKVFTCRQCEDFFENLSLLFLHARRTHVDPKKPRKNPSNFKFHCPDCDYMTNNGGTMEHHRRAHSGVKPYKCDICFKMFAQKANMKTHKNRHIHKDRIFRCETCSKSFNSHDIYLAHLRTREHELQEHFQIMMSSKIRIRCMGCNEVFDNYFYVNKHSRSCEILKSLTVKFWCIQCDVGFNNSTELKHHLKGHGGNQIIICPVCGEKGFPGFNQLNHHITRAHALKVNRRNVCRYCEMPFETKDLLDEHIEDMHHSEKNARQSRGAAGRLRCRYENCDFTSNSVMLMDRHHDQHVNNSLPTRQKSQDIKAGRGRKRKLLFPMPTMGEILDDFQHDNKNKLEEEEELVEAEIEHINSEIDHNEILRDERAIKSEMLEPLQMLPAFKKVKQATPVETVESFDDMDLFDLQRLATVFVEKNPSSPPSADGRKKRGRPRKAPVRFEDYEVSDIVDDNDSLKLVSTIKNENQSDTSNYYNNGWN